MATRSTTRGSSARTRQRKNPQGGLTAAGRAYFKEKEGANLKPGVTGKADTPEKMRRKGSFLRRHFAHPRGPMRDEHGQPTRLALSAHAWGEPVPRDAAGAKRLAEKGSRLLERYHAAQERGESAKRTGAKKTRARPAAAAKQARAKKQGSASPRRKTSKRRART